MPSRSQTYIDIREGVVRHWITKRQGVFTICGVCLSRGIPRTPPHPPQGQHGTRSLSTQFRSRRAQVAVDKALSDMYALRPRGNSIIQCTAQSGRIWSIHSLASAFPRFREVLRYKCISDWLMYMLCKMVMSDI